MEELLHVESLKKYFDIKPQSLKEKTAVLKAVDDVSFEVYP